MLFTISAFDEAGEGAERIWDVSLAASQAVPTPALIPGEMRGFVKPAELPIANHPSPATIFDHVC